MADIIRGLTADGAGNPVLPPSAKTDLESTFARKDQSVQSVNGMTGAVVVEAEASDSDVAAFVRDPLGETNTEIVTIVDSAVMPAVTSTVSLPGRRWAFMGASSTNGSGSSNFAYSFAPMTVERAGTLFASKSFIEAGVPGERVEQMAARIEATLDAGAEGLVIFPGGNDAGRTDQTSGTPLSEFAAHYSTMVSAAKRRGIPVILGTITPRAGALDPWVRPAIEQYNAWMKLWGPGQGCVVVDTWAALADPATGDLPAIYDSGDGIHINDLAHQKCAGIVAEAMREIAEPNLGLHMVKAKTSLSISPNPLFTHSTGVRATGWSEFGGSGATATYTVIEGPGDFLPAGNWQQMDIDGAASSGDRRLSTSAVTGNWSAGDMLAVVGVVEVEDISGDWEDKAASGAAQVRVDVLNQSAVQITRSWERNVGRRRDGSSVYELGPFLAPFIVPETATGMMIWLRANVPLGSHYKFRFGAVDILNLTTLGLDGFEPGMVTVPA